MVVFVCVGWWVGGSKDAYVLERRRPFSVRHPSFFLAIAYGCTKSM